VRCAHTCFKPLIEAEPISLAFNVRVVRENGDAMFLFQHVQGGNNVGEEVNAEPLRKSGDMGLEFVRMKLGEGARPFFVPKFVQFPGVTLFHIAMLFIAVPKVCGAMVL